MEDNPTGTEGRGEERCGEDANSKVQVALYLGQALNPAIVLKIKS